MWTSCSDHHGVTNDLSKLDDQNLKILKKKGILIQYSHFDIFFMLNTCCSHSTRSSSLEDLDSSQKIWEPDNLH